jgi:2',3'-cyclic-nucleotide 2'-phosphodiesterase (5'-nucleotidase family)
MCNSDAVTLVLLQMAFVRAAALVLLAFSTVTLASETTKRITFVHLNDVHSHIEASNRCDSHPDPSCL